MTTGDSIWNSFVVAAGVISPGVLALIILVVVRPWFRRAHYKYKQKTKKKV
jgi:hypothetical protein